eukprot:664235-Rhodomonas_salina.6
MSLFSIPANRSCEGAFPPAEQRGNIPTKEKYDCWRGIRPDFCGCGGCKKMRDVNVKDCAGTHSKKQMMEVSMCRLHNRA